VSINPCRERRSVAARHIKLENSTRGEGAGKKALLQIAARSRVEIVYVS